MPETAETGLLPFDVRNLNVVEYSGSATNADAVLTDQLGKALERTAREYVQLRDGLAGAVRRCLKLPLPYFKDFLTAHLRDPSLVRASIDLFEPSSEGFPVPALLRELLRAFSRQALSQPASDQGCGGYTWVAVFVVLLRRLQADCRRLCHRYRDLTQAALFQAVQDLGIEAEHLERLLDRVSDRLEDRLLDDLIVEETLALLTLLLGVNRSLPTWRCEQAVLPPGVTDVTPAGEELRVLEPAVGVGAPEIDR